MSRRPVLANSCAQATTADEARYRIERAVPSAQLCVVALDPYAANAVRQVAGGTWSGARFFTVDSHSSPFSNGFGVELSLVGIDAGRSTLAEQLAGTDLVVMVATTAGTPAAAGLRGVVQAVATIGEACTHRGVTAAGIALGGGAGDAVAALRAHSQVLLVSEDANDIAEVLSALRG